jgi:hypothetical protein
VSLGSARTSERGQSTVEWIALVLLVALALVGLGAAFGVGVPGAGLARALASRMICAVHLAVDCDPQTTRLAAAYGDELAALVSDHAPTILYERGMRALPVDYRRCRRDACAEGAERGAIWRTREGQPVVAFTRVVDCRASPALLPDSGVDCSGEAAGNVYVQYWLYYPGSATGEGSTPLRPAIRAASEAIGTPTYHPDDWESYTVRIGRRGRFARASSHHGYGRGWRAEYGGFRVSGGSHAGSMRPRPYVRLTPGERIELIPLEPIVARPPRHRFAVTPPWRKRVWRDPEHEGTG